MEETALLPKPGNTANSGSLLKCQGSHTVWKATFKQLRQSQNLCSVQESSNLFGSLIPIMCFSIRKKCLKKVFRYVYLKDLYFLQRNKEGKNCMAGSSPDIPKTSPTNANFFFINVQNHSSLYTMKSFHFWETVLRETN